MNEMKLFIRLPEVVRMTGRSRSTILRAVKAKTFPAPIHIGRQAIAWDSAEVAKWQAERIAESRKGDE